MGVRVASIPGALTSTTWFIGDFESGEPFQPQQINSNEELTAKFGDASYGSAPAVEQFFANGGETCWVLRIIAASAEAQITAIGSALETLKTIGDINLLSIPVAAELDANTAADAFASAVPICEATRCFLLIDPPSQTRTPAEILAWLNEHPPLRSTNAAVYFPWILVPDGSIPAGSRRIVPSGAMAGIYARTDNSRGVWKAPAGANAFIEGAVGLDYLLSQQETELLTQSDINCLRNLPQVGMVCWGARTSTTDVEWRYVNVRRFALFVESSLIQGLQWAVFEPNDENLWARVRVSIEDFLNAQWRAGALMGDRAEQAFFVQCGLATTMTPDDILNQRLNVLVGIAPIRPAEFMIINIQLILAAS